MTVLLRWRTRLLLLPLRLLDGCFGRFRAKQVGDGQHPDEDDAEGDEERREVAVAGHGCRPPARPPRRASASASRRVLERPQTRVSWRLRCGSASNAIAASSCYEFWLFPTVLR